MKDQMDYIVFDVEGDDLVPSKFHCLSYHNVTTGNKATLIKQSDMAELLRRPDTIWIGHNIARWDLVHIKRLLGVEIKTFFDTLSISWYLEPNRPRHSLESYGEEFKTHKIEITDWNFLTLDEYVKRCERDVEITYRLWINQINQLVHLYPPRTGEELSGRVS